MSVSENINKIKEALGDETFAKISKDMTEIVTEHTALEENFGKSQNEIKELTNDKNDLVKMNASYYNEFMKDKLTHDNQQAGGNENDNPAPTVDDIIANITKDGE